MKDPLEGVTLERLLTTLVETYGWETLGEKIRINCFLNNPSVKSSLHFLRRTPWARRKVEEEYLTLVLEPSGGKLKENVSPPPKDREPETTNLNRRPALD